MKKIIIGNWKMNNNLKETINFFKSLDDLLIENPISKNIDWYLAIPSIYLNILSFNSKLNLKNEFKLVSQNMYFEDKGAFTGEISPIFLKDFEINNVLIGHSERRKYFNETDFSVNKKIIKSLENDINPIFAFGEDLSIFENKKTIIFLEKQLSKGLKNINYRDLKNIIFAYEPIWSIGTGKVMDLELLEKIFEKIKNIINSFYKEEVFSNIKLIYGGSVNSENIKDILNIKNVDGVLVGGASINYKDFFNLLNFNSLN